MLRNVALNQLPVVERSALLLIFGLCRWLTRLLPDLVRIMQPVPVGTGRSGRWHNVSSVVVIFGVGWICGGLKSTDPGPRRRRGGSSAGPGALSGSGRTRRAREPRVAAD